MGKWEGVYHIPPIKIIITSINMVIVSKGGKGKIIIGRVVVELYKELMCGFVGIVLDSTSSV